MSIERGVSDSLDAAQREAERGNGFGFNANMVTAGEYRWVYSQMRCDVYWPVDDWYGVVTPRCIEDRTPPADPPAAPPAPPPPSTPAPPPPVAAPDPTECWSCDPNPPPSPGNGGPGPGPGSGGVESQHTWIWSCNTTLDGQGYPDGPALDGYLYGTSSECMSMIATMCMGNGGSCQSL